MGKVAQNYNAMTILRLVVSFRPNRKAINCGPRPSHGKIQCREEEWHVQFRYTSTVVWARQRGRDEVSPDPRGQVLFGRR